MSKKLIEHAKADDYSSLEWAGFFKNNPKVNVNSVEFITQMGGLHYACRQGNLSLVNMLLNRKGIKVDPKSTYGWTPLHIAVYNNRLEIAESLLTKNAKVNATTRWYNFTPLHFACEDDNYKMVLLLLKHKADPLLKAKGKKTPKDLTTSKQIKDVLEEYFRSDTKKVFQKTEVLIKNFDLKFDKKVLLWLDSCVDRKSVPIVYREEHNISFMKIEELHPFDSTKFAKIAKFLVQDGVVKNMDFFIKGKMMTDEFLLKLHTKEYVKSVKTSLGVSKVLEFPAAALAPFWLVNNLIVKPMLYQAGATVLAGELAMYYGWCFNLGGGMHHASSKEGGGWCAYGDIQLSIINLKEQKKISKAMIIDLDAHQGNGHERDKLAKKMGDTSDIFIVDLYGDDSYPGDTYAKNGIDVDVPLEDYIKDKEYMALLKKALGRAFAKFKPDIVYFNAGTDIMKGDPLGGMSITADGIIARDALVYDWCITNKIPIVYVTSGGYQKINARVIADSIKNLYKVYKLGEIASDNFEKKIK